MLASVTFLIHALIMVQPGASPEKFDYRNRLPYPEAIKDESRAVVILNLHEPFHLNVVKNMFAQIQNPTHSGVITKERIEKRNRFWDAINSGLTVTTEAAEFERLRLLNLPPNLYDVVRQPTQCSWARLKAWELPADEVITAFNLNEEQVEDTEVVLVPPHRNPLEPYVDATQHLLGKTPHFLQYTEIYYGDSSPWHLSEYQPGLRNFIGEVSGSL